MLESQKAIKYLLEDLNILSEIEETSNENRLSFDLEEDYDKVFTEN